MEVVKEAVVFVAIYHIYKMQLLPGKELQCEREPIQTEAIGMQSPLG